VDEVYNILALTIGRTPYSHKNMAIQNRQLQTLLSLINNATEVVDRHLSSSSYPAQDGHNDPELRVSIYTIEAACSQLVCEVARPSDVLVNVSFD